MPECIYVEVCRVCVQSFEYCLPNRLLTRRFFIAVNLAGEAVSSTAMKIKSRSSIAGESLLPESWQKIQLKEAAMNRVPEMFIDSSPQQAPVFTTHLQSYDQLVEGKRCLAVTLASIVG